MGPIERSLVNRIEEEEAYVEAAYRRERLRIYRMRLQAQIRSVSPLARDLADAHAGRGQLGYMVDEGDLVAAGWLGECWFHTEWGRAHLVLRADVPETLITAAVGRSIGEIVDHPVFEGRGYSITRAVRVDDGPAVAFTFDTGQVAFQPPWPELLRFDDRGPSDRDA